VVKSDPAKRTRTRAPYNDATVTEVEM